MAWRALGPVNGGFSAIALLSVELEHDSRQRRCRDLGRGRETMRSGGTGRHLTEIALSRATIGLRIGIEDLAPSSRLGQADAIAMPRNGCEIADHGNGAVARRSEPHPGIDRLGHVVGDDPAEALALAVAGMQGRDPAMEAVQLAHAIPEPPVQRPVE